MDNCMGEMESTTCQQIKLEVSNLVALKAAASFLCLVYPAMGHGVSTRDK